ncbi:unnamed protein product [Lepeophtheirus salmonis]|uniref:(salmon louse) hypothetical protein n=1 Tax=Lepeophtheirus salmonis TaxID=72036 RepID=A0A7R8CIH0_LEPSM|nr:unnamed protein product [Lepeophtheirus salmonis]CAF2800970.1 unnamed protein product [Lepeophtheirus salmonis]
MSLLSKWFHNINNKLNDSNGADTHISVESFKLYSESYTMLVDWVNSFVVSNTCWNFLYFILGVIYGLDPGWSSPHEFIDKLRLCRMQPINCY